MPLRKDMEYTGRARGERGPHQIASALAAVLEQFAAVLDKRSGGREQPLMWGPILNSSRLSTAPARRFLRV